MICSGDGVLFGSAFRQKHRQAADEGVTRTRGVYGSDGKRRHMDTALRAGDQ